MREKNKEERERKLRNEKGYFGIKKQIQNFRN